MELQIDRSHLGNRTVLTPRGVIELATIRAFRGALDDVFFTGPVELVLDLNSVTFIDSTGLGALISARRRAHAFKGSLLIACDTEAVLRVLRITGLDRVFDIVPALDATGSGDTPVAAAP